MSKGVLKDIHNTTTFHILVKVNGYKEGSLVGEEAFDNVRPLY